MTRNLDDNDPEQAERKRPFKCDECGKAFGRPEILKAHKKNVHAGMFLLSII